MHFLTKFLMLFLLKQVKTATSRIANYILFVFKSDPGTQESDITICKRETERENGWRQYMQVKYVATSST